MRGLTATLTHAAIHLVTIVATAAGGAAVVASVTAGGTVVSADAEWFYVIRRAATAGGIAWLTAGILTFLLMPARRDVRRSAENPASSPQRTVTWLLAALAIAAAWQLVIVLSWWKDTRGLLAALLAAEKDPLGVWLIPAIVISAPPSVATIVVLLFIITSIGGSVVRPPVSSRLLRACVLLQAGLIIGSTLAMPALRVVAEQATTLAGTGAIARQMSFAGALLNRFPWILAGYVVAVLVSRYERPSSPGHVDARVEPSQAQHAEPVTTPSAVSALFTNDTYRVRLRTNWLLASIGIGSREYVISPLPSRAGAASFTYSERDGTLRLLADGCPVLVVRAESGGLPVNTEHVVSEPSSRRVVGILRRTGSTWTVLDPFRRPLAQTEEVETRAGFCRFSLRVNEAEVCRYTWTMHGVGVWTAEMDVELSEAADQLDLACAIALAPLLEPQARRRSERMH